MVHNTTPYDFGWGDIVWWNFGIGTAALIAGILAAVFGYMGFHYQKRAAVSLEGREGKAFQFDMVIRMVYDSISSLISFHQLWVYDGVPVPRNRIGSLKIPLDLINPAVFSTDSRVYSLVVKLRRDIGILNLDIDAYSSYHGEPTMIEKESAYMTNLLLKMVGILDILGVTLATIDFKNVIHDYMRDNTKEYLALFKEAFSFKSIIERAVNTYAGIIEQIDIHHSPWKTILFLIFFIPLGFILWTVVLLYELVCLIIRLCSRKKLAFLTPKYYCPYIARAIINEHFENISHIDKNIVDVMINPPFVVSLPAEIGEKFDNLKWEGDVFTKKSRFSHYDLDFRSSILDIKGIEKIKMAYPHIGSFVDNKEMPFKDFLLNSLLLEIILKQIDKSFIE